MRVAANQNADATVEYRPWDTDYGATQITFLASGSVPCDPHSTAHTSIGAVVVRINVRSDWFTQDDSRRSYWETTCPQIGQTTYTCRKLHDYGSTITHELGHVLGLWHHPQQIDVHDSRAGAVSAAQCTRQDAQGRTLWRATMCPSNSVSHAANRYRTERRTIDPYDRESLRILMVTH